ncbi:MAG: hypothetical protein HAW64_01155 [Alphaproteobacteria bacterium]|nr:hypothetical protein [Alphaproteobacteria bacterium]
MYRVLAFLVLLCALQITQAGQTAQAVEPLRLQEGGVRVFALAPYFSPNENANEKGSGHIFAIRNGGETPLTLHLRHATSTNPITALFSSAPTGNLLRLIAANDEIFVAHPDTPAILPFTIAPRNVQSFLLLGNYDVADIYIWSPDYQVAFAAARQTMRTTLLTIMAVLLGATFTLTGILAIMRRTNSSLTSSGGVCFLAATLFVLMLMLWGYWHTAFSVWWVLAVLALIRAGIFYWHRRPLPIFDISVITAFIFWTIAAFDGGDAIQVYALGNITLIIGASLACLQVIYDLCQTTFMADST